ncbi:zinc-ribbon domain-containing protein [Crystallibacter degradans]|uniref:zinc-ribbon domain-containing protein n=1 Tax=Crystallibacter degradans TaxID=2726743 RepID=UPI001475F343|nr:zinc-ribbon domain-containing protein [Arthrobacter sp. SF27]
MLILFGFTRRPRVLATRPGTCPFCGVSGPQRLIEEAGKFSIFFIPIFTTSRRYYTECLNCGRQNEISRQQKDALLQG